MEPLLLSPTALSKEAACFAGDAALETGLDAGLEGGLDTGLETAREDG